MDSYQDYLQSDHWKKLAAETKRLAGDRCQVCNSPDNLDTHHRTYERKGDELQSDLVCLCRDCHEKFHEKGKYSKIIIDEPIPSFIALESQIQRLAITLPAIIENKPQQKIDIFLHSTGDAERDIRRQKNVFGILISSSGKDKFSFVFRNKDGSNQNVEFPNDTTNICEGLLLRLERLLGKNGEFVISPGEPL